LTKQTSFESYLCCTSSCLAVGLFISALLGDKYSLLKKKKKTKHLASSKHFPQPQKLHNNKNYHDEPSRTPSQQGNQQNQLSSSVLWR